MGMSSGGSHVNARASILEKIKWLLQGVLWQGIMNMTVVFADVLGSCLCLR